MWMSVMLAGCSGGEEEYPWPWQDEDPPAPAADFAGMWDFDPMLGFTNEEGWGFLYIEEPCVYMVEDLGEPHNPLRRDVVRFPEDYTRYDPRTQSIWVFHNGPATTADEITTGGRWDSLANDQELYATCPASGEFMVTGMYLCAIDPSSACQDAQ